MFKQKEQDEILNNFLDVVKVRDYFRELKEGRRNCKCKDCKKNTNVIPLYTNCHYQTILLIISTALLILAVIVKNANSKKKG